MNVLYTAEDHFVVLPGLLLAVFACAVLLFEAFLKDPARRARWSFTITLCGLGFTAIALLRQQRFLQGAERQALAGFQGALVLDFFSLAFNWIILAASVLAVLGAWRAFDEEEPAKHTGDFYGLLLLSHCGMFLLASSTELVTLFLGLELMSVPIYVLVSFRRGDRAAEAAMKYLLLGAFSSGVLLFGFSLLYGLAGSTYLSAIAQAVVDRGVFDPAVFCAILAVSAGLLFKVGAVPFHTWAPDAYQGAHAVVAAFLSAASKAASFSILLRLATALDSAESLWRPALITAAILSLTLGNLAAMTQQNAQRLLAYSSIAHTGYVLLAVVANNAIGMSGVLVYLMAYALMSAGAFLIVAAVRRPGATRALAAGAGGGPTTVAVTAVGRQPAEQLDDLAGLFHVRPFYAIAMLIFLLALAGIPPTAGFVAKYFVFAALLEARQYTLAAVAAVYVAVALYYYFRIVKRMFMRAPAEGLSTSRNKPLDVAIVLSLLGTLILGLYPEPLLQLVQLRGGL